MANAGVYVYDFAARKLSRKIATGACPNWISMSEDGKYATVNDETQTSGTVDVPTQNGTLSDVKYITKETCAHVVTLQGDQIKIMQSQCDDQIAMTH